MGKSEGSAAAQMKEPRNLDEVPTSDLILEAFQQLRGSNTNMKRVSESSLKKCDTIQKGESSHKKKRKIEVPLTVKEATPAAQSQEVPTAPDSQVNLQQQISHENSTGLSMYDTLWTSLGLPQDPFLRSLLEVKEQEKEKKNE